MNPQDVIIGIKELANHPFNAVGKRFHYEEEIMIPDCEAGEALSEMVAFLSSGAPDIISIDGRVVYVDDYFAIVRVSHSFDEYMHYWFSYNEIKNRFLEFEDKEATQTSRYIWVSLSGEDLIPNDPDFFSDDYEGTETESEGIPEELQEAILKFYDDFKNGAIEILLPQDDLLLLDPQVLSHGINRASHWLESTDCAILTAWRTDCSRSQNDSNNSALQSILREKGFGVIKVKGYYAEVGHETSSENSFITFRRPPCTRESFYNTLFNLSKQYNQDCFLYKEAGLGTPAFLIGTNEEWGMGRKEIIGMFRINEMSPEAYSKIGSGTISFSQKQRV